MTYPVFIVCRDRHTSLIGLLDWLESIGNADEVYLIDNASTWPPLLDFYETTHHTVLRIGANLGHKVGWTEGIIRQHVKGRRFIYTDPDLLPVTECPPDALARMAAVLDSDRDIVKCGFSIKIDDLPLCAPDGVVEWESKFWRQWDRSVRAWRAPIDTTFALYNPGTDRRHQYRPAFRLPEPYLVRHLPWYLDPADLDAEEAYYVAHADPQVSNWTRDVREVQEAS